MINNILNNVRNIPGWSTNKKIVVFESDDWGSIRMPSSNVYQKLINLGLTINSKEGKRYSLYDSLETSTDLELLFETLSKYSDSNGNFPIFTAVCVVANPNFSCIKENGFKKYVYEPFTETCKKYKGCENTYNLYLQGIDNKIFIPQFHGREHLNVPVWMKALRNNDLETIIAFNEEMWAIIPKHLGKQGIELLAAFQLSDISDLDTQKEIIKEGLHLFLKLFGYSAEYFVPPNGHINNKLNSVCYENGIRYRSTSKIQIETNGIGKIRKKIHWLGQTDISGIKYITRNCFFEPSSVGKDWVDNCLNDIKIAFRWNKPAIISSHRVNYIGTHEKSNRDRGLKELNRLLSLIIKNWPNVEFMSTDKLGNLISNK